MSEEIFRKKSLDKIKSPENLNDYVRVTSPGVWLLLVAVIILLAGACIWGAFGHIQETAQTDMHIKNGEAFCYVSKDDIPEIKVGMTVRSGKTEGRVISVDREKFYVTADIELPDGHYDAEIITESIKPISFLTN